MIHAMLFAVILMVFALPSFAQLYVGVQGGLSIASQSWDIKDQSVKPTLSSLIGITGGVMTRYNITRVFGIQGEVNYLRKGSHLTSTASQSGSTIERHTDMMFNYIEIPVMFAYTLPSDIPMVDLSILFGPSIGIVESARMKGYTTMSAFGQNTRVDFDDVILKKDVRSPDISITTGVGANLRLNSTLSFMFTARYLFGLTNIIPDDASQTALSINESVRNRTIIVMAGAAVKL
ncbi:MAG: PorT family protein [Candidatus Kapabacteria bacterium]|nr:PorT family protein [Candidatus Kapabacteria bacterium]